MYDAIIVGGGPAGLTAGMYLGRAGREVLLLSEQVGESGISNIENIENYPGLCEPIAGSQLMGAMLEQSMRFGLELEEKRVTKIGLYGSMYSVVCQDDVTLQTRAVIVATGTIRRRLEVPGEEAFGGRGVYYCAFCDGERLRGKRVVVCGGGDAGVTDALHMSKIASEVTLIEVEESLSASALLQQRLREHGGIKVITGYRVERILGDTEVTTVQVGKGSKTLSVDTDGVLVQIGSIPNTDFLKGLVALDGTSHLIVGQGMETSVDGIFAAGDVRSQSPHQIISAAGDGAAAAISAEHWLQTRKE